MKRVMVPTAIAGLLLAALAFVPLHGSLIDNPARADAGAAPQSAQQTMEAVAKRIFEALDVNRAAIKKEPEKVYALVDTLLLPHFDTDYAAQLVLAQNYRTATPEQRKRFVDALYHALLHTYGNAIVDFTADRMKILPFRGDAAAERAVVRTVVTRLNGSTVPVDYQMHKTAAGWKAFDVVIEGISYVRNYRTDLGAEISAKGLEEVIARLSKQGLEVKPPADKAAAAKG